MIQSYGLARSPSNHCERSEAIQGLSRPSGPTSHSTRRAGMHARQRSTHDAVGRAGTYAQPQPNDNSANRWPTP